MENVFEGCEHIIIGLYDYALEKGVCLEIVDSEISQAYFQHEKLYAELSCGEGFLDSLRDLNVHVLEDHVQSEIDRLSFRGV